MARPGITYHDVARAAAQLSAQKVRPSIEAVRRILGTGSNSTINRHLRQWISTQGIQAELEQGLPDSLLISVRGIYDAMREDANTKLTTVCAEKDQSINELKSHVQALETTHNQSKQAFAVQQSELDQATTEKAALQRAIEQLQKEHDNEKARCSLLTERLHDRDAEINRVTQLLNHAQSNLEHYRETTRQERISEKQAAEEKIASLEQQRQQLQIALLSAKEEIAQLKQHLSLVDAAKIEAQESQEQYRIRLDEMAPKFTALQVSHEQLMSEHKKLTDATDHRDKKFKESEIQLEKQAVQIQMQKTALDKAENSLKTLSDKHLMLNQEKTELAFQLKKVLETL